jgi:hypothetical protein
MARPQRTECCQSFKAPWQLELRCRNDGDTGTSLGEPSERRFPFWLWASAMRSSKEHSKRTSSGRYIPCFILAVYILLSILRIPSRCWRNLPSPGFQFQEVDLQVPRCRDAWVSQSPQWITGLPDVPGFSWCSSGCNYKVLQIYPPVFNHDLPENPPFLSISRCY